MAGQIPSVYTPDVLDLLRSRPKTAAAILLLGAALRLVFILEFPLVQGDSEIYAKITRTWVTTGIYGLDEGSGPEPTYIRLPGYPAFLAVVFALGGDSPGMRPVMYAQMLFDLLTCLIVARITREMFGDRAAWTALLFSALCPFTANYVALPLTETLSIFATALATMFAVIAARDESVQRVDAWLGCGAATAFAILLRPDGMLLLGAIGLYLLVRLVRAADRGPIVGAGLVVVLVALLPLVPWTLRNQRVFHTFQPLAPRYANAPGEFVTQGYNRWVKTWIADYVSVQDFFWKMPGDGEGEVVDATQLPDRAFDSAEQRAQTVALLTDYNQRLRVDPELDRRFAELAAERVRHSVFRYYVWLPALRIADMWLRPRTEMLPVEVRWWEFDDVNESLAAVALGALNLFFVIGAGAAAWRYRATTGICLLVAIVLVRTLFLGSLENPEPRYTLECYPIILALAAALVARLGARSGPVAHAELRAEVL